MNTTAVIEDRTYQLLETVPSISRIYDGQSYLVPFMTDLGDAVKDILLACPLLNKSRIKAVLPVLEKAVSAGVSITVCTKTPEGGQPEQSGQTGEAISLLEEAGITVNQKHELTHRYAVIDKSVVWYGNIEYLSFSMRDAAALRFESPDTAGELLELWKSEGPEQLRMELSV